MEAVIRTWSGTHVDYMAFKSECVNISDIAHSLSMICRFGGHVPRHYSVAEHSLLVSDLIKDEYVAETRHQLKLAALLHDASEAYLGDVVSPLKRILPDYQRIETNVQFKIDSKFNTHTTLEAAQAIHEADMKALYIEARSFYGEAAIESWGFAPEIVKWGKGSSRDVLCYAPSPHDIEKKFMNAFLAYGGKK